MLRAISSRYLSQLRAIELIWVLGAARGAADRAPTFSEDLVILCLEKRRPKLKYCYSPKVKNFSPPQILCSPEKFWADCPTDLSRCDVEVVRVTFQ